MTTAVICLAVSVVALCSLVVIQFRQHKQIESDLLNRLMARDWTEYRALRPDAPRPQNRSRDDAFLADLEKRRNLEKMGVARG